MSIDTAILCSCSREKYIQSELAPGVAFTWSGFGSWILDTDYQCSHWTDTLEDDISFNRRYRLVQQLLMNWYPDLDKRWPVFLTMGLLDEGALSGEDTRKLKDELADLTSFSKSGLVPHLGRYDGRTTSSLWEYETTSHYRVAYRDFSVPADTTDANGSTSEWACWINSERKRFIASSFGDER